MGTFLKILLVAAMVVGASFVPMVYIYPSLEDSWNLPKTIHPKSYNLTLQPYLLPTEDLAKLFTVDGQVDIVIVPNVATKVIVLHTRNIEYLSREYWLEERPQIRKPLDSYNYNDQKQMITYFLSEYLTAHSTYVLHFVYTAPIGLGTRGFFRTSYEDETNVTRWFGSTLLEPHHARSLFPSFDEPDFKANFSLTLIRHHTMKTVSNTRRIKTVFNGDYATDVYATTPIMSTYMLAFIVSNFKERFNGQFGFIARPALFNQNEYFYTVGQRLLVALEDYLEIKYYDMGIDKVHLAALPDFPAHAMENWGLITFRESLVLHHTEGTPLESQEYTVALLAHELSHMWFGNLVTCSSWNFVWLNEAFGRFFQYYGPSMIKSYHRFKLEHQFVVKELQSALVSDSHKKVRPLSRESNLPLDEVFDSLMYKKSASLLRMIYHTVGEENFKKSLQTYLNKHAYQNTVPKDLLNSFQLYWPKDFEAYAESLFNSFTRQVGYPVVRITFSEDGKSFNATQKRFLLKRGDGSDASLQYTIPLTYTTDKEKNFTSTTPKQYLHPDMRVTVEVGDNVNWLIVNIQQTGYYRVNYDTKYWRRIRHALYETNWAGIHELNRAQVVDDLFNLARSGEIEYELALHVLEYLETETNYLPWTAALNGYSYLAIRLGTDTENFGEYIQQLTKKAYEELGFEERTSDTPLAIYNRAKILSWSCKYGNSDCINKALSYFDDLQKKAVPVNIRSVVYCTAMREGNETNFDILFNKYKTETVATEQMLILNSLGCVRDIELVKRYFWIIVGDDVRRQDKASALSSLYTQNNENVLSVFDLVTENSHKLAESLGGYPEVAKVASQIASRFANHHQKTVLKEFCRRVRYLYTFASSIATLQDALETVEEQLQSSWKMVERVQLYLEQRHRHINGNNYR